MVHARTHSVHSITHLPRLQTAIEATYPPAHTALSLDTFLSSESEKFGGHVERFAKSEDGGEGGEGSEDGECCVGCVIIWLVCGVLKKCMFVKPNPNVVFWIHGR